MSPIATVQRVVGPDGETIVAEVILQEGARAAILKCPEDFHVPETLDAIAKACSRMACIIRSIEKNELTLDESGMVDNLVKDFITSGV